MHVKVEQIDQMGRFEQLQLAEDLWDRFAAEASPETDEAVLDELERRARWCREHPAQGKTLMQIAEALGIRL
jgi:putative addiction module component (TIGR02574 family)